jgi:hypothetical protein
LAAGGNSPPSSPAYISDANTYDGSTWTAVNSISTARGNGGMAGTNTLGLYFGGQTPPSAVTATEEFTGAGAAVTKTITVS